MNRLILGGVALLAGCGGEPAPAPSETPTTYYFRKADLYRDIPSDICRTKDPAFLQNLVQRVSAALPPGTASFDFEDFNAHAALDGKGMEALLRFRTTSPKGESETMYAVGPFDPSNCHIGPMQGGVGADPHGAGSAATFEVK